MSGEADKAKGRIEQAVGDLTDDKDLKREGKSTRRPARSRTPSTRSRTSSPTTAETSA